MHATLRAKRARNNAYQRVTLTGSTRWYTHLSSGDIVADLYQKALESERRSLWAECRLKGLAKDTPARIRIAELDELLAQHKAKKGVP